MTVELFKLSAENASLLDRIAPDVFDNRIESKHLTAFLADPRHVMFLAVDGDSVVGMASGVEYFHPDKPPQLFINEVGVAATHRRRGIGKALTSALIHEARRRGCVYAWLGTACDNVAAQACFGAVPDGGPAQSFFLYEWDLEEP